jgi:hypothetical protein
MEKLQKCVNFILTVPVFLQPAVCFIDLIVRNRSKKSA